MTARTIRGLVQRMEMNETVAIARVATAPTGSRSLLSRMIGFSSWLYGPTFHGSEIVWSGKSRDYWGHNAIIRVAAICHRLPGNHDTQATKDPVIRNDWAEVNSLVERGWAIASADELGGSFEQGPTTIAQLGQRRHQWTLGLFHHNTRMLLDTLLPIGHLRSFFAIAAQLAAPLGAAMLLALTMSLGQSDAETSYTIPGFVTGLVFTILTLLVTPHVWVVVKRVFAESADGQFSKAIATMRDAIVEVVLAIFVSPILVYDSMIAWFVRVASGETKLPRRQSWRRYVPLTFVGAAVAIGFFILDPLFTALAAPIWLPWALSIPFSIFFSSETVGNWMESAGLLPVQADSDSQELMELKRQQRIELRKQLRSTTYRSWFDRVIRDREFRETHCQLTEANETEKETVCQHSEELERAYDEKRVDHLDADARKAVLESPREFTRLAEALVE